MSKDKKRYLALDIGNVCLRIHPERLLAAFEVASPESIPMELWLQEKALECGKITEEDFLKALRTALTHCVWPDEEVWERFGSCIGEPLNGVDKLFEYCQEQGIEIVFFSDTSNRHLQTVRKRLAQAESVKNGIYSFEVGCMKPAEGMFEAFEEGFGVPVLYLDDRAECIEAAQKRGWPAAVFVPGVSDHVALIEEALRQG